MEKIKSPKSQFLTFKTFFRDEDGALEESCQKVFCSVFDALQHRKKLDCESLIYGFYSKKMIGATYTLVMMKILKSKKINLLSET